MAPGVGSAVGGGGLGVTAVSAPELAHPANPRVTRTPASQRIPLIDRIMEEYSNLVSVGKRDTVVALPISPG